MRQCMCQCKYELTCIHHWGICVLFLYTVFILLNYYYYLVHIWLNITNRSMYKIYLCLWYKTAYYCLVLDVEPAIEWNNWILRVIFYKDVHPLLCQAYTPFQQLEHNIFNDNLCEMLYLVHIWYWYCVNLKYVYFVTTYVYIISQTWHRVFA